MSYAVYRRSCPNCGGSISEERLKIGLPCERCLPDPSGGSAIAALRQSGKLMAYEEIAKLNEGAAELTSLFERAVGGKPWGAQRSWIKRLVRGDSFSIIAPTGTGKSTFGRVAAIYHACVKGGKAYVLVPTSALVTQEVERIEEMLMRIGCAASVVGYHSKVKRRKEILKRIEAGDYKILVTTASFARSMADLLSAHRHSMLFVDDVDSALKSRNTLVPILRIAGFSSEAIEAAESLVKLQGRRSENRDDELERERQALREVIDKAKAIASQVIVSSATIKPRGLPIKMLSALLGFTVGGRSDVGLRNVEDLYVIPQKSVEEEAVEVVKKLGPGALVFVPVDEGVEGAERIASALATTGLRVETVHSGKKIENILDAFEAGKIDVLVGVAMHYGPLVRGLDLPQQIKYAVFAGIPRIRVSAEVESPHPLILLRLLMLISRTDLPESREASKLLSLLKALRRRSAGYLERLRDLLAKREAPDPLARRALEALALVRKALSREEAWQAIARSGDVGVAEKNGRRYLLIPDLSTYLQASGRTSRLYGGSLTKGLSIVIVDNEGLFKGLVSRTSYYDIEWKGLNEVDLESLKREVEESRRIAREGGEIMRSALFIVESPNKARTIAFFFGQPSERILPGGLRAYEVAVPGYMLTIVASGGHVFDLVREADPARDVVGSGSERELFGVIINGGYAPVLAPIRRCLSCGHQFTEDLEACPRCGSKHIRDASKTIEALRRLASEVDEIFIATDPDTEGERIGWDVALALIPYNKNVKRAEFHEVTKREVLKALQSPRELKRSLVEAQLVRRIEDRWIGFTLSPLLWCDFWPWYCEELLSRQAKRRNVKSRDLQRCAEERYNYNLSAGRVQTPVLGWVIERHEEAKRKIRIYTISYGNDRLVEAAEDELSPEDAKRLEDLAKEMERCKRRKSCQERRIRAKVSLAQLETSQLSPPPPFTTDSMIADADRYLSMGADETMRLAQDLFEFGLITYHRTDSTRVSDKGIQIAEEWIKRSFPGLDLFKPRRWSEEGAHEAIRPTRPLSAEELERAIYEGSIILPGELTERHFRLYDLIFRRFIASQMKEAVITHGTYEIEIEGARLQRRTIVKIGEGDARGFLHVWSYGTRERPLPEGEIEVVLDARKRNRIGPLTQGELVAMMRARGIGRPSTYSKIVETLVRRRYVIPVRRYLVPTLRGERVYAYLSGDVLRRWRGKHLEEYIKRIPDLVSEKRTKELEERMVLIEEGKESWTRVLDELMGEIGGLSLSIRLFEINTRDGMGAEIISCMEGAKRVLS